ncbi:MAG: hypothetical protein H6705_02770 [Myxococcales bacterium]|nr:hypothetical protein [Myxococcales bacterium]
MLHDLIFWVLWTLATAGEPMVRTDFSPYDGPLADRLITERLQWYASSFTIDADTPELRGFEQWLKRNPLHVRAPGHKYLVYGMRTYPRYPGEIFVNRFNLLLKPEEQPMGPWEGYGGDMLAWAFSVLDHYGFAYDPEKQFMQRSRANLIEWYNSDSEPIDWHAVAERLRSTGRPVPDDLFDQPTR